MAETNEIEDVAEILEAVSPTPRRRNTRARKQGTETTEQGAEQVEQESAPDEAETEEQPAEEESVEERYIVGIDQVEANYTPNNMANYWVNLTVTRETPDGQQLLTPEEVAEVLQEKTDSTILPLVKDVLHPQRSNSTTPYQLVEYLANRALILEMALNGRINIGGK